MGKTPQKQAAVRLLLKELLADKTQAADLLQEARNAVPGSAKLPRGHEASSGGSGLNREQKAWLEQWVWTRGPLVNVTRGGGSLIRRGRLGYVRGYPLVGYITQAVHG